MPKRAVRSLLSRNRRNTRSSEAQHRDHDLTCLPLIDQTAPRTIGEGANRCTDGHQAQDRDRARKDIGTRAPEQEKIRAGDDEVAGGGERLTGGRSGDTEAGYDTR